MNSNLLCVVQNFFVHRKVMVFAMLIIVLSVTACYKNDADLTVPAEARFSNIRQSILEKIEKGVIPSLSLAVAVKGKIVWMESFGWADKENRIKAAPDTLYSIASVSKSLTATGVMHLYERNRLCLDENINKYSDTFNLNYHVKSDKKVTCRNLMNHTSGLQMHFNYFYDDENRTIPPLNRVVDRYGFIATEPSESFAYANLGYGILGEVISETSGTDFNKFMKEEIFLPLGMTNTTFDISSETKARLAKRYDMEGKLIPCSFSDTPGAGNASSTARDLIEFGMFHINSKPECYKSVLSRSKIELMQKKQYTNNKNGKNNCGLGWFINDRKYRYRVISHAGGMDGVDSMLKMIPSQKVAVVVLINKTTYNASFTDELSESILEELIPDLKEVERVREKRAVSNKDAEVISQRDLTGRWEGKIKAGKSSVPITLLFQKDGDIHVYTQAQFNTTKLTMDPSVSITHKKLLNKWFFNDGHLVGWYAERIPDENLKKCPHVTLLDLKYVSGKLTGVASALPSTKRMYYGLSYYLSLQRKVSAD